MAGNFFISLLLATALQYLWGMVNSLQLIVMGVLFDILQPENAKVIQLQILKACSFDFFYTEDLYKSMFGFKDSESFNDNFEEAGIEGSNFIIGVGPVFFFIVIFPIYMCVHKSCRYVFQDDKKPNCCSNWLQPKPCLPIVMVFLLESCVEIGITCGICLTMINGDRVSTFWEILSTSLAFLFAGALVIAPLHILITGLKLHSA